MDNFKIGNVQFNKKKCVLIAEAGVNHNGSLRLAEKLIVKAKEAGADIIKFQTYKADKLVTKKSPRFWNWKGEKKKNGTQYDSYKNLDSFNKTQYVQLVKLCKKNNIEFMSTPFDIDAVKMLDKLGMKGFKVASCDLNNYPLLEEIIKTKKPILLSTGASNLNEVRKTVKFLEKKGVKKLCLMQCTLSYPTEKKDVNLSVLLKFKKEFKKYLVGLSDHTLGVNVPISSVLLGSNVIEKHFTVDKTLKKSADHWLSVNPKELNQIRVGVDELMEAYGDGEKKVLESEKNTRKFARRSIVAKSLILKNETLTRENLTQKRPGDGIEPSRIYEVLGKKAKKNFFIDEKISLKHLK